MLTFELTHAGDQIEIHGDEDGLRILLAAIERALATKQHDHLFTPSWSGNELTEDRQGTSNTLINGVTIHIWPK